MKTTTINKFDYPTAASHTYKLYSQGAPKGSISQQNQKKIMDKQRYKQVIQQQRYNERVRVKMQQERRQKQQKINNKKKIQQELKNKRLELIELDKRKAEALEAERKSYQMAILRQEQEKINQMEKERKSKQNQFNAQNRFISALKRLEEEKDLANIKNKEALNRRKVAENTEKIQREKAMKYRQLLQQKQKNVQPQQKRSFKDYKQNFGRTAFQYTVDYTRTHLHNPMYIEPNFNYPQNDAMLKAEQMNKQQQEKQRLKRQQLEENRKVSLERGQTAIQKIRLQQEYDKYRREEQMNAIKYNLERVEAGKKNQYIGIKPSTIAQMQSQRKIRRQQEFQKMFFNDMSPASFAQAATRYNIGQARLGDTQIPLEIIPLNRGNPQSRLADISHGQYSFEDRDGIEDLTTVKKQDPQQRNNYDQRPQMNPIQQYENKRLQNHYRSGDSKQKEDLSYSQSEQDSHDV